MAKRPVVKKEVKIYLADPNSTPVEDLVKAEDTPTGSPLVKSILNALGQGQEQLQRLAFEVDPTQNHEYAGIYKQKVRLVPDNWLKRVAIQDDLVAAVVNTRSQHLSVFGRPQPDRFSYGFKVEPKKGVLEKANETQKAELTRRTAEFTGRLLTCGKQDGWAKEQQMSLPKFLRMQARNAVVVGRWATEFINEVDVLTGEKRFHSFRPIDAGTIFRAAPYKNAAQHVRDAAKALMETLFNKKFEKEKFDNDEYTWIQVIDGKPVQAFTGDEVVVWNAYPVTDIELQGYPLTPLDTVIAAVTTHINITTHNKLFFQSGRAARGMLVIKSEDIGEPEIKAIRQQFQASINNANNSWRMPVFQVGQKDEVSFVQMDTAGRDAEFQFLQELNARTILAAFQMSPSELPGYDHLMGSGGGAQPNEKQNEFILEASRDVGLRPLVAQFQDFLNQAVFPVMDPDLAALCEIKLIGLDADDVMTEAARIAQTGPLYETYDGIMRQTDHPPIGRELGGDFPLNIQVQQIIDKHVMVGVILEKFFGIEGASQDPRFQYIRDPFFFQWQQYQDQKAMMQQQAAMGVAPGGEGEGDEKGDDLEGATDELGGLMNKAEKHLSLDNKKLVAQQDKVIENIMSNWEKESKEALDKIVQMAEMHSKKKKG